MADFVSAVDDRVNFTPQAEYATEAANNDILNDAYNSPHQGNWEVASGFESFVDAHCATVHKYRPSYTQTRSVLAIDQGLAKRLMQATVEEKRAQASAQQVNDRQKSVDDKAGASPVPLPERRSKAFVVPPLQHSPASPPGYNIELSAKPPSAIAVREQTQTPAQPRTLVPSTVRSKQSITPGRSPLSQSRDRMVQIVGKKGEQALVRLPSLRTLSSGTEAWQNKKQASNYRTASAIASAAKAHSRRSDSQAAAAMKDCSGETLNQPKLSGREKKKEPVVMDTPVGKPPHHDGVAADPTITRNPNSIAKSPHSSPRGPKSAPGSCKDSGIAMSIDTKMRSKAASGISQAAFSIAEKIAHSHSTAKAPVSTAAAPTSINIGSKCSSPLAIQHPLHQQTSLAAGRSRASAILPQGNGSKAGTLRSNYRPPTVQSGSSSPSVIHSFRGFRQDIKSHHDNNQHDQHQISRISKVPSAAGSHQPVSVLENDRRASPPRNPRSRAVSKNASAPPIAISRESLASGQKKTNFAGDGWISPHPLSVASIDVGASPQAAVRLSTDALGQSGTLTYEEWKARRDDVASMTGSYAPSHVPSAMGIQTVPLAYNHDPPAESVGSYHEIVPRGSRHSAQTHSRASRGDQWHTPASDSAPYSPHSLQQRAHSDLQSVTSNSEGSIEKALSVLVQDAGWSSSPKSHGSGSGNPAPYTVGITSTELGDYQQRLGSIVSRYSSHLSLLQAEQAQPQRNYGMWNSRQSHASKPSLPPYSAHQSYHSDFTVSNDQALGSQSGFAHFRTTSLSGPTGPEWPQPEGLILGSQRSVHAPGPLVMSDPYRDHVTYAPSILICSPSEVQVSPSQVTYGTNEWQDLENAEEGRGRYEDPGMW